MIKSQGQHNCGWAFPAGSFPYLIVVFVLTFIVFFSTLEGRKHIALSFSLILLYVFLFLAFFLTISIVALCWCSDPETVTKTYIVTSMVFMGDIAIKGSMFNGLV